MQHIFFTTDIQNIKQTGNMTDIKIKHYTENIHYEMEQTVRLMKKMTLQIFQKLGFDISPDEYAALDIVSMNAGICQRDLAKLLLKDRANTGRILDSLEEKGLVTRFIDTKNNRLVKKMGITEKGYKKLNAITKKLEVHVSGFAGKFSHGDVEKMHEMLKNFRAHLEEVVEMNI